jgi:uncharacterized protein YjbJ (UPF0337 family)
VDTNRVTGTAKSMAGKVEDAYGRLTGDTTSRAQGTADQASGAIEDAYGRASDMARDGSRQLADIVQDRPIAALLMAAAAGYVLSWMMRR